MSKSVSSGPVHIHAYAESLTLQAGDLVPIMVSATGVTNLDAQLVRLIHGDVSPDGPGFVEEEIQHAGNGSLAVRHQPVQRGNYLLIDDPEAKLRPTGAFTLWAYIFPTLLEGRQTIFSWDARYAKNVVPYLEIDDGYLAFVSGDGSGNILRSTKRLLPHIWYAIALSFRADTQRAELHQRAITGRYNNRWSRIVPVDYNSVASGFIENLSWGSGKGIIVGGRRSDAEPAISNGYNGKIDRFGLLDGFAAKELIDNLTSGLYPAAEQSIALWDTTIGYGANGIGDVVHDAGPNGLHAVGFNRPVRGQTGWNWDGTSESFVQTPSQYGGIEFHDDALTDCAWTPTAALPLPKDLKSGVYALRLSAQESSRKVVERAIFFVTPRRPKAPLALLLPTATYLAYANGPRSVEGDAGQAIMARTPVLSWRDIEAVENGYEFGLSTYDVHRDGAGVCYSSARRPIFTMQPDYRNPGVAAPWGLAADLSIVAWLEHCGYEYDVITDEMLEADGKAALSPYRAVINGTHCEYYSEKMLDATEDYLADGGRLLYLSGNGYYWVVAFRPDEPWTMEVRRREGGSRAWEGRAGEGHLATNARPGGIWRHRNRAPQKLVGTGFASEGMDLSFGYRRIADAGDRTAEWIFEGVEGDTIGDFGLIHGGAVGLEIDRYDPMLGSPPHAVRLAASELLTDNWPLVCEDIMFNAPALGGDQSARARCDMVYFSTTNGGAVFSPSSIAWAGSLPINGFDNNVSRIMRNVVDRFLSVTVPA